MDFKVIVKINETNIDKYNALFAKAYQALKAEGQLKPEAENNEGRFLSLNHYLAHAKELLALDASYLMIPLDEDTFDINAETRQIKAKKIVVLQNDNVAETIQFTIDRYFDQMDLNQAKIFVQWKLPSGKTGATWADEMKDISIPGKIRFGWTLTSDVTAEPGVVEYSVRFWNKDLSEKQVNGESVEVEEVVYSLNTLTSSLTISKSLQASINDELDIVAPKGSGLFERAVRNSHISIEGADLPLAPYFFAPGANLPAYASLEDDTLTLKAQAIVGDTGVINYEWYYKPAVNVDLTFNDKVSGEEVTHQFKSEIFYPYNDVRNADNSIITYGFSNFGGIVNNNVYEKFDYKTAGKLNFGDRYFVKNGEEYIPYASTLVPDSGDLYEKYTTYTVPAGEAKVTGQYKVCATNTIAPNTTAEQPSSICQLVSPDDIMIDVDLPEFKIISGPTDFEVKIKKQSSSDVVVEYNWSRGTDSNATDEFIDTVAGNSYTITTPGWYQVAPTATLNRETKSKNSKICKVTFDPVIPSMSYTEESKALIPDEKTIPYYTGNESTLEVVVGSVIPEAFAGYSEELFSEKLTYKWMIQAKDTPTRELTQTDIDNGLVIGVEKIEDVKNILKVSSPEDDGYTFTCLVSNTLNGKTVTSGAESLAFYVV